MSNPGCEEVVQAAWNHWFSVEMDREISTKVENFGNDLIWWNMNVFGSIRQDLVQLKQMLIRAKFEAFIEGNNSRVR